MEDIVGDYADKTVTLEDFPFLENGIKMASVHPCRHASVMKTLLDRADAALKLRLSKVRASTKVSRDDKGNQKGDVGLEGLVDDMNATRIGERHDKGKSGFAGGVAAAGGGAGDEWEVLQHEGGIQDEEVAIRVDQYLVVFVKFLSTMTPSIEHDYTMGI